MPSVNPATLKRLLIMEALLPFALKRRLSAAQLGDLVHRATSDRRFDVSATSNTFAGLMNEAEASDWAFEFERAGTAPHIFSSSEAGQVEMIFGMPKTEFEKQRPEVRLQLANQHAHEQRRAKN